MGSGIATLSINLETRLAEMQAGFDRAARLAEKNASDIEARYARLSSVAAGIGATLAAAFSTVALTQFFRTTLDGLGALQDLADATGASVENLSALEDIAARTGTAFETVESALVRFNAQLTAANAGSQTAELLKRIGLNAQELRRLDPAEALRQTAVALSGFADDGNKARLVQELFGKSVGQVAPLLRDLAEAGRLNASVTRDQIEQADRLSKALSNLGREAEQAKRQILGPFIAAADQFFRLQEQVKSAGFSDLLQASFAFNTTELQSLDNLNGRLTEIIGKYVKVKEVVDAAAAAGRRPPRELLNELASLERQERFLRILQKERGGGREDGPRTAAALPPLLEPPAIPKGLRDSLKALPDLAAPFDPLRRAAEELVAATDLQRLGQLQLQLQGLLELGGDSPSPAVVEALQRLGKAINELTPGQRELREKERRIGELLASTPSGQLGGVLTDIELINGAFEDGRVTVEQWAEAQRSITARLPQETERALQEMSEVTRQFQSNVQNVLGDNIASVLRGDFDSIEDAWKTMLLNMIAQATAADLARRLFGPDGQGGGWLSQLASVAGFAKGGAFSQGQPITAFADGGVLTRPTFFGMGGGRMGVAGEAGYEGILPLRRGPGGRLGVEAYGGGGTTNIYNVAAGVTRAELMSALQLMGQQTRADVFGELRRAGVL